ncbi:MAG: family 2 glycosyl transferase [Candidatus Gottesmanbacteria bacterium GW2011_GWA2_43_14]|uniref:Family 2 glycosyl transferase n=1 Tax=Candidatus Gottesmanbacteria bacterium GW2011_GWA2_43_14 TaxID=1618443 RepID=A0A0G1GIM0_9BACT|nr:MAG: family 2 glycosyl transferase [Candidatus Gottesmanbacteria bacterium GW2011_GWA2_43_14]
MSKPTLSVIIVNYNTLEYLSACLVSLYNSSLPDSEFEVIVTDNASRENPANVLKKKFPKVKILQNKTNTGFAKANNRGVKYCRGQYVLFLNPDTLVGKQTLRETVLFLEKNPQAAVVTARVNLPDGSLDDACHRGFPTPWNAFCHFSGLAALFPRSTVFNGYHLGYRDLDKTHEIDSCVGAFMMVRKEAGGSAGWFDESYFWYGEDLDFCYRLKKNGWKIFFLPRVSIIHYKGVSSGLKKHTSHISTASRQTKIRASQARYEVMRIFYRKHYNRGIYKWLSPLIFFGISIKERLSSYAHRF